MGDRALADQISASDPAVQRRMVVELTTQVLGIVPVVGAQETIEALLAARYGDSPLRQWLESQGDHADSERLAAEEDLQRAQLDGRDAVPFDARRRQRRNVARAYILAYYALDPDPDEAAQESVYEASFILDKADLTARVLAVLNATA